MVSKQKRNILLTAVVIIALVVVSAFAMTNQQSDASLFGDIFTSPASSQKNDSLPDANIAQLSSGVLSGVEGDQSAYTSVNGVATLGDSIFVSDETGKKMYRLSLEGDIEATYDSTVVINGSQQ